MKEFNMLIKNLCCAFASGYIAAMGVLHFNGSMRYILIFIAIAIFFLSKPYASHEFDGFINIHRADDTFYVSLDFDGREPQFNNDYVILEVRKYTDINKPKEDKNEKEKI